jgi:hypothetical protein
MKRAIVLLVLAAVWQPTTAPAQSPPQAPPTTIVLRPAAEPDPALKYRLVPERNALVPGNAANLYYRALHWVVEARPRLAGKEKAEEQIANWAGGVIGDISRDKARQLLEPFQYALKEVELGATRFTCDWEFDQRKEGVYLLLPEIQESRTLARLVGLKARLAILDGKTDLAIHWIETGLVMGRHVGQGPIAIQALVGIAIDFTMLRDLEDLIQAPGTPSLYWALADRPRPFIDMRYPLEGERYVLEKELPTLRELDRGPWSLHQAQQFVDELETKLFPAVAGESIPGGGSAPLQMPGLARRLGIAAMAAKIYPEAKRGLIARGQPAAQVEAMPVVQVATLYTIEEYQRARDESYKWMNVPYWQSYDRIDRPWRATAEQKLANPLLTLFSMVMPALRSLRLASIRLERQFDALQCIEAIRLYAAAHGGKLPESLEAMTDAPAPLNPATGKPFSYKLEGNTATLSAPAPPGGPDIPAYTIGYVLKPAM